MATDHMYGMDARQLLRWMLRDLKDGSALGIVNDLFFTPRADDPFRLERYGVTLESPLGAAAGPHTQMAQNIVAAWLTGARYMELKTVQVLDQISVTKPCIDMNDEGYNCEWSQELTLDQSYREYLKAWVLLHILHDYLGGRGAPGMIFNMSAGYSMEGILSPTVQRFLDRMGDAAADVKALTLELAEVYPRVMDLNIPGRISDNLTISCMHGCPPGEVESIALYFIEQRGLHTTLKLNPTLLGAEKVRGILNDTLGYPTRVPDLAFEHDIPYSEALRILTSCREAARKKGVRFSAKLTNTLETSNIQQNLPDQEKMVYMSGRALHPISICLAAQLQKDFNGDLDISFCAGVDAMNVADVAACGLTPVTICSDLLKPGGYGRMAQYIENLRAAMGAAGASSLDAFVTARAGLSDIRAARIQNLEEYAARVAAKGSRYARAAGSVPDVKTARPLPAVDCAAAPCASACPAGQNIPAYLERAAAGDLSGALEVILDTNPFPHVLGKMCNQACRKKCVRAHYDEPLRIRDVKACAAGAGAAARALSNGCSAAVIGAGPAGLSCAYFLAMAGCSVEVYEASEKPGGRILNKMTREAARVERDVNAILALGVKLHTGRRVRAAQLADLAAAHDSVYLALGQGEVLPGAEDFSNVVERRFAGASAPSVVESVGEGRRAAGAMLARMGVIEPRPVAGCSPRASRGLDVSALRRRQAFRLDACGAVDAENVGAEAARCLQCDRYCGMCVSVCPNRANLLLPAEALSWPVQEAVRAGEAVRVTTLAQGGMRQSWQVVNLGDFCNECGNCAAFCPSAGAPYRDKARLHLSESSFNADANGYFLRSAELLEGKAQGEGFSLRGENGFFIYEDARMRATLDAGTLAAVSVELREGVAFAPLTRAVEAAVFGALLRGSSAARAAAGR